MNKNFLLLLLVISLSTINAQVTYYVSSSGNDYNNGLSPYKPWKTISKINQTELFPGDEVLFNRGDSFHDTNLVIKSNGEQGKRIRFGAYGNGEKPKVGDKSSFWLKNIEMSIYIIGDYVTIEDLHVIVGFNSQNQIGRGICLKRDYITVQNCTIEGNVDQRLYFGISTLPGIKKMHINNNEIFNVGQGIYISESKGLVENNYVHDIYTTKSVESDGIRILANTYGTTFDFEHELIISNNEITRWKEDAIDDYNGINVIIEKNKIHNPQYGGKGNGISIGGYNNYGSIIRNNHIYDLYADGSQDKENDYSFGNNIAIVGKQGLSAKIYYNLIHDIAGVGITRTGDSKDRNHTQKYYEIYNNTIYSDSCAVVIWGSTSTKSYLYNNILQGGNVKSGRNWGDRDIRWHNNSRNQIIGGNNIFVTDNNVFILYPNESTYINSGGDFGKTNPLLQPNYSPQSNSPAINNGTELYIHNEYSINNKPDIGAFEYFSDGDNQTDDNSNTGDDKGDSGSNSSNEPEIPVELNIINVTASSTSQKVTSPLYTIDGKGYNDGDSRARWATYPVPQWICYDLGKTQKITKTRISFYNFNNGRVYSYSILVSNDNKNWDKLIHYGKSTNDEFTENTFEGIEARYVKYEIHSANNTNWVSIWETKILGLQEISLQKQNQQPNQKLDNQSLDNSLNQNHPNPFNPETNISFQLKASGNVSLKVYNINGQEVATLLNNSWMNEGTHQVRFKPSNLASGVYFYRIKTDNFTSIKKMLYLK